MQKLFEAGFGGADVLAAANEEFPPAAPLPAESPDNGLEGRGWNAYEIWRTRIRPGPGVMSLFVPQR